jgi:cytochrome c
MMKLFFVARKPSYACGAVALFLAGLAWAAADANEVALAEAGKKQFVRCSGCHALSADAPAMFGPHLEGIVDRRAGSVEGYAYTEPSLRDQTFVWDEAYFDEWLENPQAHYPGMCMPYTGLSNPEIRKALIAYLKRPVP